MHGLSATDPGKVIDWGKTTEDYAIYHGGPPSRFYECLKVFGIGAKNQKILDLGTGTGVLARQFAYQGSVVCGIDISGQQIEAAIRLAEQQKLNVDFRVGAAESIPYPDQTFDVITANQCWLYFDTRQAIPEVKRVLKPDGVLVTSHFCWLPRVDPIARATEQLVLKYNPAWSAADFSGAIPNLPSWAGGEFEVIAMFFFDEEIPFSRESWRGRIRACRGIGASLSAKEVERFDCEHNELLAKIVPEEFRVRHRIDAHILNPLKGCCKQTIEKRNA